MSSLSPYTPGEEPWTFIPRAEAAQARIERALSEAPLGTEGYVGELERFHESLVSGGEPPVTAADGTFTATAPAGPRTLFILGPKGPVARKDVDVTQGGATDVGTLTAGSGF